MDFHHYSLIAFQTKCHVKIYGRSGLYFFDLDQISVLRVSLGQRTFLERCERVDRGTGVKSRLVGRIPPALREGDHARNDARRHMHGKPHAAAVVEDVDRVAHLVGERNVTVGQQYLLPLLIGEIETVVRDTCLLYTSPSPRDCS